MVALRLPLLVIIFFLLDNFVNHFPCVVEAQGFPYERPFIGFATGTLASTLLEKLLRLDGNVEAKCALSFSNKLTKYRLINPFLYLEHGENPMPVPLKIETNSTVDLLFQAAGSEKDTSGLVFYEIATTAHILIIFWKVTDSKKAGTYTANRFYVDVSKASTFTYGELSLKSKYDDMKQYSKEVNEANSFMVQEILLQIPGKAYRDNPKITIRAQMTSGKDGKLTVEIDDNLGPVVAPPLHKRVTIPIGLGLTRMAINFLFKLVKKYIPSDQSGTILLENKSNEVSLVNPSWCIFSGSTTSIVPWEIEPSKKGAVEFVSPFLGTNIRNRLDHTVHCLSYQIHGTDYHLVIASWFPWKVAVTSASFTLFVMKNKHPEVVDMKSVLSSVGQGFAKASGDVSKLKEHLERTEKSIIDSIPDRNMLGVKQSKLQRYLEWQYPIFATFTPTLATRQGKEYHVKIVAAVSFGKAFGLSVTVEVVAGSSKRAAEFAKQNPQAYQEPPEEAFETSTAATGTTVPVASAMEAPRMSRTRAPETATSEARTPALNVKSANGNVFAGTTVSGASGRAKISAGAGGSAIPKKLPSVRSPLPETLARRRSRVAFEKEKVHAKKKLDKRKNFKRNEANKKIYT